VFAGIVGDVGLCDGLERLSGEAEGLSGIPFDERPCPHARGHGISPEDDPGIIAGPSIRSRGWIVPDPGSTIRASGHRSAARPAHVPGRSPRSMCPDRDPPRFRPGNHALGRHGAGHSSHTVTCGQAGRTAVSGFGGSDGTTRTGGSAWPHGGRAQGSPERHARGTLPPTPFTGKLRAARNAEGVSKGGQPILRPGSGYNRRPRIGVTGG